MTVSYENTAEDAYAWDYYHQTHTRAGRHLRFRSSCIRSFIVALVFVASRNLADDLRGQDLEAPLLQLVYAAAAFAIFFGWTVITFKNTLKESVQARIKKNPQSLFLGEKKVELLPEGLRIAWDGGYAVRNWSALQNFSQTETHFVFFYDDANFVLIPKCAIDVAHQQEFRTIVERFRAGAGAAAAGARGVSVTASSTGAPWWRNRNAVDATEEKPVLQQRRP